MKREKLLSTHFVKLNFTLGMMIIVSSLVVSCTNQGSFNQLNGANSTTTAIGTDTASGSGSPFKLDNVVPSQNAASSYDLIGEGAQFDTYCQDTASPNTKCQCQFQFTQTNVGTQISTSPITYQESNLVRCTSAVPSGITTFSVAVVTIDGTYSSNQLSVNLNNGAFAGSTTVLDLTNALSFVQVQRFQCRKHEFIADPLDQTMLDPFQSEDPHVIYPFNYYTTNVADSMIQLQNTGNQDWECTLTGTQNGAVPTWANPIVFSAAPCTSSFCSGDQSYMDPTTSLVSGKIPVTNPNANGKRRASFWLAKQAYGVFTVAVQANVAPNDYVSALTSTIGYAALPIPDSSGSSSCPVITLPANATWVKLWNFSATNLTSPNKVVGSNAITQSGIACNPLQGAGLFPSCDMEHVGGSGTFFGNDLTNSIGPTPTPVPVGSVATMAARVALFTSNAAATTGSSSASTYSACYREDTGAWLSGLTINVTNIGDTWTPSPYSSGPPTSFPYSTLQGYPWGLYAFIKSNSCVQQQSPTIYYASETWAQGTTNGACTDWGAPPALPAGTPSDTQIQTQPIYTDNYSDQLFVVVDPAQNDSVIQNGGSTQYIPVTFRSSSDCPGPGLCSSNANAQQILWQVISSSNPPATPTPAPSSTPSVAPVTNTYPLCVVQFYD